MKKVNFLFIMAAGLLVMGTACNQTNTTNPQVNLTNNIDSVSFAFGYQQGSLLERQGAEDLNYEQFLAGLISGMNGNEVLTDEELFTVIRTYQQELQNSLLQRNQQEGEEFLAENATKEGVTVTESGLQYTIVEEGTGASPSANDTVVVNYEGTLLDGTVFDSSFERGEPIEFPLNRVIRGWTEGVQLMKEGASYEFVIPSELAYGRTGAGNGVIPPQCHA